MLDAGFTTLTYLKSRILPAGAADELDWDDALAKLGLAVAHKFNNHCNRIFQRVEDQADEFSALNLAIVLRAFPVEEITTLQIRSFTGTLTDFTGGYQLDQRAGLIQFRGAPGERTERLVVTYTGGHWLDDGTAQPAGTTALPADILEASIIQAQTWAEARNLFGTISLDKDRKISPSALHLTADIAAILEPHRRYSGE